jgi:hypothetical protein
MGYTTDFEGDFELDQPLSAAHENYLRAFSNIRHMKRDNKKLKEMLDERRKAVKLRLGKEGEFYVGSADYGFHGQDKDPSILEYNYPPKTQPGLWCHWVPTEDAEGIEWDGGEKFYYYVEWLEYIVNNFLKPWGYTLNGSVRWRGEEFDDVGRIDVENNVVIAKRMKW